MLLGTPDGWSLPSGVFLLRDLSIAPLDRGDRTPFFCTRVIYCRNGGRFTIPKKVEQLLVS